MLRMNFDDMYVSDDNCEDIAKKRVFSLFIEKTMCFSENAHSVYSSLNHSYIDE